MKKIEFVNAPPELSCHADVVAKDIVPATSVALIDNGHGFQIRAIAAGSAVFEGRPVRLWIITIFEASKGHRILTVTHASCDVPRERELAEVRELVEATLHVFLDGDFGGESLQ